MSGSIFDQQNEEYLRKFIETDERTEANAHVALDKVLENKVKLDVREVPGNKTVSPSFLPSKGVFYPSDLVITISPLKVKQIRHFSTIDENDEIDISTKLNFIINSSVMTQTSTTGFLPSSMLEIDRLYLLFLIRNITFVEFPSIIKLESACTDCGNKDMVDVKAERLGAIREGSLDEYLSMYSSESRSIVVELKNEKLNLYLPSIHNLDISRNIIARDQLTAEDQDKFMLCFLVPPSKKLTERDFSQFEDEMNEWSPDKYTVVKSFINKVNSSYSVDVYYKCSGCGAGVATPLRFHRGIKELFVPEFSNRS